VTGARVDAMKMIAEYLEHSLHFEHLAAEAKDAELKTRLLEQAKAYRKLAEGRAKKLRTTLPPIRPRNSN
jgi:hypothetical protein